MPKRKAKPTRATPSSPAVAAIIKVLSRRKGATVLQIAKARGLRQHTVRSILSRVGSKAGLELTRTTGRQPRPDRLPHRDKATRGTS